MTRFITHVAVLLVNKTNVIKAVCSMLVHYAYDNIGGGGGGLLVLFFYGSMDLINPLDPKTAKHFQR